MNKLLLALILAAPVFAATNNVTSGTVFKLDASAGVDTNGGGWDAASAGGTGTDHSTSSPVIVTGVTCAGSSATTITASGSPWDNTLVGNTIQIASGTNFSAGFYTVSTFTDANNLILNVSPCTGSAASVGATRIGGQLLTLAKAATAVAPGNYVYVKASATYTTAASINFSTSGSSGLPITWVGYTSTITDGGQATVQASGGSISVFNGGGTFQRFRNFIVDSNSKTSCNSINLSGANVVLVNVKAMNFSLAGVSPVAGQSLHNVWATGGISGCTAGFNVLGGGILIEGSAASSNNCIGFRDTNASGSATNTYIRDISANNIGASSDGWQKTAAGVTIWAGCVAYGNGRDGWRFTTATSLDSITIRNSVAVNNAGYGINSTTTNWTGTYWLDVNFNAYFGNSPSSLNNLSAGTSDATLTGDPFVSGASGNFALNNTAGAGAALRAAGFPGTVQYGGTGYLDIGAIQHQDTGGGGATPSCPIAQ